MSAPGLEPEYDRSLVEAALLVAIAGRAEEPQFRAERDRLYEIPEPERREVAFTLLHACWFERLGLQRPFREELDERPEIAARCGRWLVARAREGRDEAGDLLVAPGERPTLLVRVTPESVAVPERLRWLLRRELLHVSDMLDPRFGYDPVMPDAVAGAPWERVVRDNYRVLWNAAIDGRLVRRGRLPADVRAERFREFARAFPHPGAESRFGRFFDAPEPTHAELLAFAVGGSDGLAPSRCRLCNLPAQALEPATRLPVDVLAVIARDFPKWHPSDGLCGRCAEVYASRAAVSAATAARPARRPRARAARGDGSRAAPARRRSG